MTFINPHRLCHKCYIAIHGAYFTYQVASYCECTEFAKLFEHCSCAILQGLCGHLCAEYSSFYFGGKKWPGN